MDGFGHVIAGASLEGAIDGSIVVEPGNHEQRATFPPGVPPDVAAALETVRARHDGIEQHDVWGMRGKGDETGIPVGGFLLHGIRHVPGRDGS